MEKSFKKESGKMKKFLVVFLVLILLTANCFAEKRTRIDRYNNITVEQIWDDSYSDGFEANMAESFALSSPGISEGQMKEYLFINNFYIAGIMSIQNYTIVMVRSANNDIYMKEFKNYNDAKLVFDGFIKLLDSNFDEVSNLVKILKNY